jgi:hypothetical protein
MMFNMMAGKNRLVPLLVLLAAVAALVPPLPAASAVDSARWVSVVSGTGRDLNGVWGASSTDIFAVGNAGTVLHYDGRVWGLMKSATSVDLWGVWGSSGVDVYAVGNRGTLSRYDGQAWTNLASDNTVDLRWVWGSSSTDVFAVGSRGTVKHFDGRSWSTQTSGVSTDLNAVWGAAGSSVYAAGKAGAILRYDGRAWSAMGSGTTVDLNGVWGSADASIYAVGRAGTILHYDGRAWSNMASGTTVDLYGVWGSSGSSVIAVGAAGTILQYDGTAWSPMTRNVASDLRWVWGFSPADNYAVGAAGAIVRYAPPVVSSLNPTQGSQGGTLEVTIIGRNLDDITGVNLGPGIAVSRFTVSSPDSVTASITIIPGASVGARDLTVTTPAGSSTIVGGFNVLQALPIISGVTPSVANQETSLNVTLSGANFSGATGVNFGPGITVNSFGVQDAGLLTASITITAGAPAGSRGVSVVTPGGVSTLPAGFTVKQALPVINSVSPLQGIQGATLDITLSGRNFNGTSEIRFGPGVAVNRFTVTDLNEIIANVTILASATTGNREVSVTTPGGSTIRASAFSVIQGLPVIASVTPAQGSPGETLDILVNGANLDGATAVNFGGGVVVTGFSNRSATQVAVRVTVSGNAAAGSRDISVTAGGGTGILAGGFSVREGPPGVLFIALVWVGVTAAVTALVLVLRTLRRRKAARL